MNKWLFALGLLVVYATIKGVDVALAIKPGVVLSTEPEVLAMREAVQRVWTMHGFEGTITSSMDGQHMHNSKHYYGLAEDYRTHDLPDRCKHAMFDEVREILGVDYQVIFEGEGTPNEHLHIEYDPH